MKLFFLACSVALMAGAYASQFPFVEEKGVMEFSGRMIVRPLQQPDLIKAGYSLRGASQKRQLAHMMIGPSAMEYVPETDEYVIPVAAGAENRVAADLMSTGIFQYVEPDWIVYPADTTPNDPGFATQWHHPKIQAPAAWDLFRGNSGVTVAITDTGVKTTHEDLAPLLVPGYNAVSGLAQVDGGLVEDVHGHGTHCCGIAGAAGNNAKGVSGVGWNLRIMPVRVTNSSSGSASITALTNGARWAADHGARVVSTSYSGVSSSSVQTTGNYIKTQRNGIYIWAAGNSNTNLSTFDHLDVTIVGATDSNDAKASFSSYGLATDVYAPGVSIYATLWDSPTAYGFKSGTSMATPCAAGVAGMIMATNPALTGADVETALYQTCDDLGPAGNDEQWGWGRVNVNKGIRYSYDNFPFVAETMTPAPSTTLTGTLSQATKSDDSTIVLQNLVSRVGLIQVEFSATTSLLSVGSLTFTCESSTSNNAYLQFIDLFDFTTNTWVNVSIQEGSLTDQTVTATPALPARFVQPGTGLMRARIRLDRAVRSALPGKGFIDYVSWKTTP